MSVDEDSSKSVKGKDFYYNGKLISFDTFKRWTKMFPKDIINKYRGFHQTFILGVYGTKKSNDSNGWIIDPLFVWNNYNKFRENLDFLGLDYDIKTHELAQKVYDEWKTNDLYFEKDKENAQRKMVVAPTNNSRNIEKLVERLKQEEIKQKILREVEESEIDVFY